MDGGLADLNLPAKWFLVLAIDASAPDHSAWPAFARRLWGSRRWEVL